MKAPRPFVVLSATIFLITCIATQLQAAQVMLAWDPPSQTGGTSATGLAGYMVYYGPATGFYNVAIDIGLSTTAAISGLTSGHTYYFAITAYDTSGRESAFSNEVVYTVPVSSTPSPLPSSGGVTFAVNVGGWGYIAADGTVYNADMGFSGGRIFATLAAIDGTVDDALYQSQRYGDFSYAIPVKNGNYVVILKFAEIRHSSWGRRFFDVLIEGVEVVSDLNLYVQVGRYRAYDVQVPVSVSDGILNITFRSDTDDARVNAIVVKPGK